VRDARRWGLPEAECAALAARLSGVGGFTGVWPQNRKTADAFLACATQWRLTLTLAEGRLVPLWIGLDYAGARIALEARGMALTPGLFAGLQLMEVAARDHLNGV
jgi:hypothetical protein